MWAILCFGDSITWGAGERPAIGWVGRLKREVEADDHRAVYNLGVCGDTTDDLLRRLKTECDARVRLRHPENRFLLLFAIGTNDSRWYGGPESTQVFSTEKRFAANVLKIIRTAKKYPANVAVIGPTPVDEKLTVPYEDTVFRNERIALFNDIVKRCCAREHVAFLDMYAAMKTEKYSRLLDDGLHPNARGVCVHARANRRVPETQNVVSGDVLNILCC